MVDKSKKDKLFGSQNISYRVIPLNLHCLSAINEINHQYIYFNNIENNFNFSLLQSGTQE